VARSPVHEKGNAWLTFCQVVMYPVSFLLGRRKTTGRKNVEIEGGYLLVANHISHLDPLFDSVAVRKSGRVPRFMAKASLWKVPVLGKALAGSDQIPVERSGSGAGQKALELATEALAEGRVVLIYPEGTVTRDPGHWPMKPRPGIGSLALAGDFPVIPVAHWGSHQVYASYVEGRRFKPLPRKDVHTVFGEPIDLTELRSRPVDARAIRDASLLIMTVVRDMVAEVRGETPPVEFYDHKKAERIAQRAAQEAAPGAAATVAPEEASTFAAAPEAAPVPIAEPTLEGSPPTDGSKS
jgi:1-acyl-sn-glycerol-3-phosphate acyltransferase